MQASTAAATSAEKETEVSEATSTKPLTSTEQKPQPTAPESVESSLAMTMRQLGVEAAEKAKEAKTKARTTLSSSASKTRSEPSEKQPTEKEDAKEAVAKLDNSTAPGIAPPSGTSESTGPVSDSTNKEEPAAAETAPKSPETNGKVISAQGAESPIESPSSPTTKSPTVETNSLENASASASDVLSGPANVYTKHRGSSISAASKEEIREIEEATKVDEEPEEEAAAESGNVTAKDGVDTAEDLVKNSVDTSEDGAEPTLEDQEHVTASDEQEDLPGSTHTQSQEAADAKKAGDSVAD